MFLLILPQLSPGSTLLPYQGYVNKICSCRENRRQKITKGKGEKARVRSRASHVFSSQSSVNQMEALQSF